MFSFDKLTKSCWYLGNLMVLRTHYKHCQLRTLFLSTELKIGSFSLYFSSLWFYETKNMWKIIYMYINCTLHTCMSYM